MELWVELSGENPALARAEAIAAAEALGGWGTARALDGLVGLDLPDVAHAIELAGRLALARRVLVPWVERERQALLVRMGKEGKLARRASIRPLGGSSTAPLDPPLVALATSYLMGGGSVDLATPERVFVYAHLPDGALAVAEEVARVDRSAFEARRMPKLPFRRPVSLPPRRGRVAMNLARVRRGDRILDPFAGTGALLLEGALLGARVTGVDVDASMIRGAARNFAHLGLDPEALLTADAATLPPSLEPVVWDAIVTDPPYGRASGTRGEDPQTLLARAVPTWATRVREGGRVVVVAPGGPDVLGPPWVCVERIPDRVHRSLTREFRVYERRSAS